MRKCKYCKKELTKRSQKIHCSLDCLRQFQYDQYIDKWKKGILPAYTNATTRTFPPTIKRYFLDKYGEKCMLCGWDKKHPKTGKVPIEIDHIDGNADNNREDNLRLICSNCHSLTNNFRNHNKGNGREWRKNRYTKVNKKPA